MSGKVAIVTGGSSGIGLHTAIALRAAGCTVYEISRRESAIPGVTHIGADVADEGSAAFAVQSVFEREGRLDILVNNAGFGISGAAEFTDNADAKSLLDVNLFGAVNTSKAAIPLMRARGGGRIVFVSSMAAAAPIPFQSWYCVSKAAVNAYGMALANEVGHFGISVCIIMPGDIKTGFTGSRRKSAKGEDVYGGRIGRSVAVMEKDEENGASPEKAAACICRVALKRKVRPLYSIGAKYGLFSMLIRILPASLVKRIINLMYVK